jgi:transcription initiation factor TFIID subunit 9B
MASSQPQTNGVRASSDNASQNPNASQQNTSQSTATAQASQQQQQQQQGASQQQNQSGQSASIRPRDARLIELLLTSQGVTAYEQRVPLLLMDFAYRHTSSILSDALHLSGDPYITQAGSKGSGAGGAIAPPLGDASVSANAVKLAIGARLSYQFRGGNTGGGISKEYMQELARDRNRLALPKIVPNEWGVRLPSERFVLTGTSWGLKDMWHEEPDEDDEDEEADGPGQGADAMEGIEGPEDVTGGEDVEGGTVEDVFGDDVDAEMAEE